MGPSISGSLTLENHMKYLPSLEGPILQAAEQCGFQHADLFAIKLGLEEAMANAVRHGNRNQPDSKIHVQYTVSSGELRITIQDEGHGFDPAQVADPTLDENLEKPSGRGLLLMRVYMTEVIYSGCGNCVTLIKRPTPSAK